MEVVDAEHPITQGLQAWDTIGEAWGYFSGKPDGDCHILLATEHPKMPCGALAWTHTFGKAASSVSNWGMTTTVGRIQISAPC